MQKDCEGPTYDFDGWEGGNFTVVLTCHKGSIGGPPKVTRAKARLLKTSDKTRFRMSFFGGLVHQDYWIPDHADDNSWAVMATPGGHYVWLLSRGPALPPAKLAAALARADALGYPSSKFVYPGQGPG